MNKRSLLGLACALTLVVGPAAAQEKLRIGFINTLSGGGAVIGKHQKDGWDLGVEMLGGKIGGLETEIFVGDDQQRPDVGLQLADRMVKRDRVHFVTGVIWSNILLAIVGPVTEANVFMITTNAGASPMAGKQCNKDFFTTSWNNDQTPEAMGKLMQDAGVKNVFMVSPNYQAGKDMLTGFQRYYKGGIKGEILFKLGQSDFQAEMSQVRAARPDAVFAFVPGAMGIAWFKQWAASGLGSQIKLYTGFSIDETTLGAIGDAGVGTFVTAYWTHDLPNAANKKFVEAYRKKFGYDPSHFAAQSYDAPFLIDSAVKAVKGNLADRDGIRTALRKTNYESVRGPYKLNTNHVPIQSFYRVEVVKDSGGKIMLANRGVVFKDHIDSYVKECPMKG